MHTTAARRARFVFVALFATIASLVAGVGIAPPAGAASWTPLPQAAIHPGVQTVTGGSQCTANFIFTNGADVLIGQAAHCSGLGSATDVNGCTSPTLPLGTPVAIDGASRPGTLVYSSWVAMQAAGTSDGDICQYNDFALVRIDPADVGKVNPSVPRWGGPTGLSPKSNLGFSKVYSYGNSSLRLGVAALSPKVGYNLANFGNGRAHFIYSLTPGVPGDSGAALLDGQGRALGVLSTVGLYPFALSNNYADLSKALDFARAHGMPNVQLVRGTKAFKGGVARVAAG